MLCYIYAYFFFFAYIFVKKEKMLQYSCMWMAVVRVLYIVALSSKNIQLIIIIILKESMNNKRITQMRLQKESASIERDPIPNVLVHRQDELNFHFCFYGLEEQYHQGFYHGLLELAPDYPFSPPKIKFYTNNGRFEADKFICTTFTHYHKQTWSSTWNIRNILTALISFMYSQQRGIGGVFESPSKRKQLAAKSLSENMLNSKFVEYFKEKLLGRNIVTQQKLDLIAKGENKVNRRRKRQRSQATLNQERLEVPQLMIFNVEEEGFEVVQQDVVFVKIAEEGSEHKRRRVNQIELDQREQLANLQVVGKRRKMQEPLDFILEEPTIQKAISEDKQ